MIKMVRKNYLMTPGPAPVPIDILLAGAQDTIHHRTPQYLEIQKKALEGAKVLFQTSNDVILMSSSGTGAMETAVSNLVNPGDKVIVINSGKFGERWLKLCKTFGANIVEEKLDWGVAIQPERLSTLLKEHPDTKIVFTQLNETSTGGRQPIKELAAITRNTDTLIVVDAISGLLAMELKMDEWGVDVVITGVQKGFMMPPGVALISLNERAWKAVENCKTPRFYFDLRQYKKNYPDSPWTPPINLIYQLERAVEMLLKEGIENIWARHELLAQATRAAVQALGLKLYAKDPGNVLTSVCMPENISSSKIIKMLRDDWGVVFADGQDDVKGKIARIAHLGYMSQFDIITAIAALEMGLTKFGYNVELGKGVRAAQEVFMKAGI